MSMLEGKRVFLVPATLRPETMYGQTNCFLSPKITYGAFEMKDNEVFICVERAVRNMAFQGLTAEEFKWNKLADLPGD
jgi:leucyl-tRNA synthetase